MVSPLTGQKENLQTVIGGLDILTCAQSLRHGHKVNKSTETDVGLLVAGSCNVHLPVNFEDGVKWLARIQLSGFGTLPRPIRRMVMQGEINLLRWLKGVAQIPME
jgi:hypothetical protein